MSFLKNVGSVLSKIINSVSPKKKMTSFEFESEIRELLIDDTLSLWDRIQVYNRAEPVIIRLFLVKALPEAAREIGHEKTIEDILPLCFNFFNQPEPPIRTEIVIQAVELAKYLSQYGQPGYDAIVKSIVTLIVESIADISSEVRNASVTSLAEVAKLLNNDDIKRLILPLLSELANSDTDEEHRECASQLIGKLAPTLGDVLVSEHIVPLIETLARDPVFKPRKTLALSLGPVSSALPPNIVDTKIFPVWLELSKDIIWGVRKHCVLSLVEIVSHCSRDFQINTLPDIPQTLLCDASRWVRTEACKILGELISVVPREHIPSSWLLFFVTLTMNGENLSEQYIKKQKKVSKKASKLVEIPPSPAGSETGDQPVEEPLLSLVDESSETSDASDISEPKNQPVIGQLVDTTTDTDSQTEQSETPSSTNPSGTLTDDTPSTENSKTNNSSNQTIKYQLPVLTVNAAKSLLKKLNLTPQDSKRRTLMCAFNLPAIAETLGIEGWHITSPLLYYLATHTFFKIRQNIAYNLYKFPLIVGPEVTTTELVPLLENYLSDVIDVSIPAVDHLAEFLSVCPIESRNSVVRSIIEFANYPDSWRLRRVFATQLVSLSFLFSQETSLKVLFPLALSLMNDPVFSVRIIAQYSVGPILFRIISNLDPIPPNIDFISKLPTTWCGGDAQYENLGEGLTHDHFDFYHPNSRLRGLNTLFKYIISSEHFPTITAESISNFSLPTTDSPLLDSLQSIQALSKDKSFVCRQNFCRTATSIITFLPPSLVPDIIDSLFSLAKDKIPNVRLLLSRFLNSTIFETHPILGPFIQHHPLFQSIKLQLLDDVDPDVSDILEDTEHIISPAVPEEIEDVSEHTNTSTDISPETPVEQDTTSTSPDSSVDSIPQTSNNPGE